MPRVSILLTCFNHIRYLPACVEGIRRQTFTDFEIVAIDDGSADFTREWLAQQTDIRCIFNEKNLGTYETLNVGLRATSGELVAVLNDDDLWAPEKLERQVSLLDANPQVGLVHTGGTFIDGEGKRLDGNPLGFAFPRFETGDVLLGLVYENKVIASAALVRRECFEKLGGFNSEYFGSGDWEMWFRIAEQYHFGFVDAPLTHYRVHGANASHKLERIWRDDEKLRTWIALRIEKLGDRFPKAAVRRAQGFNQAALGTVRTLNGNPADGRQSYAASIRLDPLRWKSYARYLTTYLSAERFRKLL
jgi:glycosyltransferase involved in cell wall biosynthesis